MRAAPVLPSTRESVETFHLLFLRLRSSGPDRSHYVVKGGCNLRFWFGSVRFSENIDLDVHITSKTTLKKKIDRLLEGGPLKTMLGAKGLMVSGFSAPKQTEVTQRWKVGLTAEHLATPFQTKIEFSRRQTPEGSAYEPLDRTLTRRCALPSALGEHYLAPAAISQKIAALAHRTETQARDIFDLARSSSSRVALTGKRRRRGSRRFARRRSPQWSTRNGVLSWVLVGVDPLVRLVRPSRRTGVDGVHAVDESREVHGVPLARSECYPSGCVRCTEKATLQCRLVLSAR